MLTLAPGSTNLLEWEEMTLASNGLPVTNATVPFVLKDAAGNAVSGGSGNLTYVVGSVAKYQGTLASNVVLIVGATYFLEVPATSGGVATTRRIECTVQWPDESEG